MYKQLKNESGISLLELIAALLIASILVVILMTTFSVGMKHNVSATDQLRLQQEANLVIAKITAKHQSGECYNLDNSDEQIYFILFEQDEEFNCTIETERTLISNDFYRYSVDTNGFSNDPKKCDMKLELTIMEGNQQLTINSAISRIKTSNSSDGGDCT